jgi:hypothetical protein
MYADPEGEVMEGAHLWAVCALNAEYIKTRDQEFQNVDAMFGIGKKAANKLVARFLYASSCAHDAKLGEDGAYDATASRITSRKTAVIH